MTENLQKLIRLLEEMFQLDQAELDFGIYRIMNYKRDVISKFLEEELPRTVAEELKQGALAEQSKDVEDLSNIAKHINETLGQEALDPDGNLSEEYRETPLGRRYRALRARIQDSRGHDALEASIFNHLHTFFGRYYQEGDFISKRRYSRRERYAIPYNGEEIHLHWANCDQYYIKTAEYFHDYSYMARGTTVHFKLTAADVEQNNVKGDKRFFVPRVDGIVWDPDAEETLIPFEYRPLTQQEAPRYGSRNQQDKINDDAIAGIPKAMKGVGQALAALTAERHKDADGNAVSFLAYHIRQYTRRNTSDYFIHKDLKGFLARELDFYLKNEVLGLDELESGGPDRAASWFQLMRVIRVIGTRIIDFLDQIESFQKMLWEKRKLVTETQYCIAVGQIDERFYGEIAENAKQWEEWKALLHIDEQERELFAGDTESKQGRLAFLRAHPTVLIDTVHFSDEWVDELLGSFQDLESLLDGLLLHSENFQALVFLLERYRDTTQCVYLDPPYNSQTTEILYKNTYKHSSWLSLMDNRLAVSRLFSTNDGSHVVAIDENEQEVLGRLLSRRFPQHEKVCVTVVHNKKGIQGDYFSYNHDFAYFCIPPALPEISDQPVPEDDWDYDNLRKWGRESERETAKNCFYPIFVEQGSIVGFGDVCDEDFHPESANVADGGGRVAVYPIDSQGVERKWRYARQSVEGIRDLLRVHTTRSGEVQVHKAKATRAFKTVWDDAKYIAGDYGTKWLTDLGIKVKEDLYPKSLHTVEDAIVAVADEDALVCDYFAGSGTTGHAVVSLNRDDGGRRRFIMVEMGEHFDTVLLPRVKKIAVSPEWEGGRPRRLVNTEEAERSPRIVKYLRLESYEDALNNLEFDEEEAQTGMQFDDYILRYMLRWETRKSETFLPLEKLARPFSYRLAIHRDGETKERAADIPESFNYLLGLKVRTRRVYSDDGRRYLVYRGDVDHRQITVIWRETQAWEKEDLERDREFVAAHDLTEGADEVFVNGDSFIPDATPIEPVFKARMFAGVEA